MQNRNGTITPAMQHGVTVMVACLIITMQTSVRPMVACLLGRVMGQYNVTLDNTKPPYSKH